MWTPSVRSASKSPILGMGHFGLWRTEPRCWNLLGSSAVIDNRDFPNVCEFCHVAFCCWEVTLLFCRYNASGIPSLPLTISPCQRLGRESMCCTEATTLKDCESFAMAHADYKRATNVTSASTVTSTSSAQNHLREFSK